MADETLRRLERCLSPGDQRLSHARARHGLPVLPPWAGVKGSPVPHPGYGDGYGGSYGDDYDGDGYGDGVGYGYGTGNGDGHGGYGYGYGLGFGDGYGDGHSRAGWPGVTHV